MNLNGILAVLISLIFFITSCVGPTAAAKNANRPRFCPDKDVWIIAPLTTPDGEDLGMQPVFIPRGEFGATSGECPDDEVEVKLPVVDKFGKLLGETEIKISKGYLDDPKNVFSENPKTMKKKKPVPRPKRKRRIPPADNIRTWHAND
jgi:hypothetical protein